MRSTSRVIDLRTIMSTEFGPVLILDTQSALSY